ncbi:MAG: hypothetical protein ACI8V0_002681 [Pseudohongiellaceae bacterium]|jgi:hypothetical protein
MSLLNTLKVQFQERLIPALPAPIRGILEGGSKKQLLARINQRLLLVNNELIHLNSGRSEVIGEQALEKPFLEICPEQIASAASKLMGSVITEGVILYLPPSDFVATSINMPGVSKDNLMSALKLQVDNLFPSFADSLDLTLGGNSVANDANKIALWFVEKTTSSLFEAFKKVDLFLVAVAPRNLIDLDQSAVVDFDSRGGTLVELDNGSLSSWLHINQLDLHDAALNGQWLESLEAATSETLLNLNGMESFYLIDHSKTPGDYCFIPSGAMLARKKEEKGRNILLSAGAFVFLIMLSSVPFLIQSYQFRTLAATLATQRLESADARENRAVVVSFENEWGQITDFPLQELQQAMFTLQNILQPDQLASFELSEGVIKIQGTSSEPQAILQRLEQHPMFTEVVFSRATNNSRYYIDLRLSTVNFEGYMARYFPDA